jgi:hypothetical protein
MPKEIKKIFFAAFLVRLIAVVFSKGYGMHDDHFVAIEGPYSWILGLDYTDWYYNLQNNPNALIFSFWYPKINFLILKLAHFLGLHSLELAQYFNRFFHAIWSMGTLFYGYKIALKIADEQKAKSILLFLSFFWIFPFLAVRNLVEFVCIPPLMASVYYLMADKSRKWVLAGFLGALAVAFRFQLAIFFLSFPLILCFQKSYKKAFLYGFSFVLGFAIIEGGMGWYYFKKPFYAICNYFLYNIAHKNDFIQGSIFKYFLDVLGMFITIGLFMWIGFYESMKRQALLSLPILFFLIAHSVFPNKQERFIFPILPLFMILSWNSWMNFIENKSILWQKISKKLLNIFWSLNIVLLMIFATYFPKKSRIQLMEYFANTQKLAVNTIFDLSEISYELQMPYAYSNFKIHEKFFIVDNHLPAKDSFFSIWRNDIYFSNSINILKTDTNILPKTQFLVICNAKNEAQKVAHYQETFNVKLKYITKFEPVWFEKLLHKINPANKIEIFTLYKIQNH